MQTALFRPINLLCLLALSTFVSAVSASPAGKSAMEALARPGHVLLMRHAHAPGVGDPPGMTLGDCASQRNLDERGRRQAVKLGERLRTAGVTVARVYTSQWCRCRDTARLMALGPVEELPVLNSFFEQPEVREERLRELRAFLAGLPRDGASVVLVTHQVTVTALTG
jgi:phosphohistidine phosphatase SixA